MPDSIIKGFVSGISQKEFNDTELSFVAYASKEVLDRDGEIVKADAWELDRYKSNPVVLLSHNHDALPVARAAWTKMGPEGLQFKAIFASTPAGQEVYQLYKEGILNAFSCGFIAKEWEEGKNFKDAKYRAASRVYTKAELLEISCVSVPSCPDALVQRTVKGLIKDKALESSLKSVLAPILKPEPEETENEIRVRVKDPALFEPESFRRVSLKKDKPKVFGVVGKLKGEDATTLQSYRFPKADGWNMADAKAWVKEHSKKDITASDITKALEVDKTVGLAGTPSIFDVIDGIRYGLSGQPVGYQYVYVEDIFPTSPTDGSCIITIAPHVNDSDSSYWHYDYKYDMATETALLFNPVAVQEVYQRKHFITEVDKAGRELSAKNITMLQGCAAKMHEAAGMIDGLLEGKVEPKAVKEPSQEIITIAVGGEVDPAILDEVESKSNRDSISKEAASPDFNFAKQLIDSVNKKISDIGSEESIAERVNREINKRLGILD